MERLLPAELIGKLADLARSVPEVTVELCEEADQRWSIVERYGLSRRRLLNYLRRLPRMNDVAGGKAPSTAKTPEEKDCPEELRDHRTRQASVGSILDSMFGPLAECQPELWERRAYLMLVGLVYERLAVSEGELPTDELVAFAKVLAENRRVEARLRQTDRSDEPKDAAQPGDGKLPPRFGDVVRQLYGTNFHQPDAADEDESSNECSTVAGS